MLVAVVVGVVRGVEWVVSDLGSSTTAPAPDPHGKPIRFLIPAGADASEIGAILEEQGVVDDPATISACEPRRGSVDFAHTEIGSNRESVVDALDNYRSWRGCLRCGVRVSRRVLSRDARRKIRTEQRRDE